jgi:hypothetical protein
MRPALANLLADADVFIDYRNSDLTILKLVSDHIGPERVLREVLDQAPSISDRQCTRLGIEIVRLETELMLVGRSGCNRCDGPEERRKRWDFSLPLRIRSS